jgi:hypothetical protein
LLIIPISFPDRFLRFSPWFSLPKRAMLSAGSNHDMLTSVSSPVALLLPAERPFSEHSSGTDPWHGDGRHCQTLGSLSVCVLPLVDSPLESKETLKVSSAASVQRRMAILTESARASVPLSEPSQIRWRGRLLAE